MIYRPSAFWKYDIMQLSWWPSRSCPPATSTHSTKSIGNPVCCSQLEGTPRDCVTSTGVSQELNRVAVVDEWSPFAHSLMTPLHPQAYGKASLVLGDLPNTHLPLSLCHILVWRCPCKWNTCRGLHKFSLSHFLSNFYQVWVKLADSWVTRVEWVNMTDTTELQQLSLVRY